MGASVLIFVFAALAFSGESLDEMISPIAGLRADQLHDSFSEIHNGHPHGAIDIMEPRGTPVRAAISGKVARLFLSKPGGNTIYLVDDSDIYCYYYAHLDSYAANVHDGLMVKAGDVLGYVGSTGDADVNAPHLHFEISRLGPEKHWWGGTPLNPYSPLIEALRRENSRSGSSAAR
jgi:murein DD-endopeptidase MepM/ murein hydrolase activator NlpD